MDDAQHSHAAFINAIREEGTKEEACDWLQITWGALCKVKKLREKHIAHIAELRAALIMAEGQLATFAGFNTEYTYPDCERAIADINAVLEKQVDE